MNKQEILERAISKAIDGGWVTWPNFEIRGNGVYWIGEGYTTEIREDFSTVIFSHGFAKALWGDGSKMMMGSAPNHFTPDGVMWLGGEPWKFHLQHMVIADNPVQYLGDHI